MIQTSMYIFSLDIVKMQLLLSGWLPRTLGIHFQIDEASLVLGGVMLVVCEECLLFDMAD